MLVAAAGALLLLVVFGQFPTRARWGAELADAAHGPAFAILTLLLFALLRPPGLGRIGAVLIAATAATSLGAIVELVQWGLGRDASMTDLLHDALGAATAAGAVLAWRTQAGPDSVATPLRVFGASTAGVAASVLLLPVIEVGAAYLERERSFPVLVDFGHWTSTFFVDAYGAITIARERLPKGAAEDTHALHARLSKRRSWSIALYEPNPDWRGRRTLALEVVNPADDALAMEAWIRDRRQGTRDGTGFRLPFAVAARSRQTVRLPLPAPRDAGGTDLADVGSLFLVHGKSNRAREFHVLRIWLE
jgi:hypothetical protein